jgi:hypothetical protein
MAEVRWNGYFAFNELGAVFLVKNDEGQTTQEIEIARCGSMRTIQKIVSYLNCLVYEIDDCEIDDIDAP